MIELTAEHVALARRMANTFASQRGWHLVDEFESAAMLALSQAAASYDNGPVPFTAWASIQIRGRMIDAQRSWLGRTHDREPHGGSTEFSELLLVVPSLEPTTDHVESDVIAREDLEEAIELLSQLPERERLVVLATAKGCTQAELAEALGVTTSRVCQIITRGREFLTRLLAGESPQDLFGRKRPGLLPGQRARLESMLVAGDVDVPGRVRVAPPGHAADHDEFVTVAVDADLVHGPGPLGRPVHLHFEEHAVAV